MYILSYIYFPGTTNQRVLCGALSQVVQTVTVCQKTIMSSVESNLNLSYEDMF